MDFELIRGEKYNFRNQPERLIYLGNNWSSNGYWHQFVKVDSPERVWAELLDSDLQMIEATDVNEHVLRGLQYDAVIVDECSGLTKGIELKTAPSGNYRISTKYTKLRGIGCLPRNLKNRAKRLGKKK